MLKIVAGSLHVEITTGTPYEQGTIVKYYLRFSNNSVAAVYKSGILKKCERQAFGNHQNPWGLSRHWSRMSIAEDI